MNVKLLLLFFVGLLLVGAVNAATYYVSPTGTSSGSGTQSNPWNLVTALSNAVAGDTVLIMPGAYSVTGQPLYARNSGTPGNYITFKASDPNNKPVITNAQTSHMLWIIANYVMFKDLILHNGQDSSYTIDISGSGSVGRGVILDGVEAYCTAGSDNIYAENFQDGVIRNSKIVGAGWNGVNIQIVGHGTKDCSNFLIENNSFYNMSSHHSLNIFPSVGWSTPNYIENFTVRNNFFYMTSGNSAIFTRYVKGFKIYNNIMVIRGNALSLASGDSTPDNTYDAHGLIANNVMISSGNGRFINDYVANYLTVKNNIIYGQFGDNTAMAFQENYEDTSQPLPIVGHDINNNIYYSTTGTLKFTWGSNIYSSFSAWKSGTGFDMNGNYGDPLFTSLANYVLALQQNSFGIDHGTSLSQYFTTDYLGVIRPQGPAWDIGAYEYVSGSITYDPADTNQNGCISLSEMSAYVQLWLGGQGVTLGQVSSSVAVWLQYGC